MVTITKQPKRNNIIYFCKKVAALISLLILLWAGLHWLTWFHATFIAYMSKGNINQLRRVPQDQLEEESLPIIKGVSQPKINNNISQQQSSQQKFQQKQQTIISNLSQLSNSIPLYTPLPNAHSANDIESKFNTVISKECIPGRDDTSGEINPTTHRKRECLRHVPLGNKGELEYRMKLQKPRIGILIPPSFIGHTFATWIESALQSTSNEIHMDIEIIITSSVPVYGYGKSHGYTKLIRLNVMPLSLAVYDSYLYASHVLLKNNKDSRGVNEYYKDVVKDMLDEMKLGRRVVPPDVGTVGLILQLIMRWHCRMSHVSAHTAMLTISLEEIIADPIDVLSSILSFTWREDWDWEGHGGQQHPHQGLPHATWKQEADEFVSNQQSDALDRLMEQTLLLLDETISSTTDDHKLKKSMQGAFASEMKRSSDMTSWPCPSFWEGMEVSGGKNVADHDNQMNVLQQISSDMVPNCKDDDLYTRCTVNKDKCEVKRDAKCL